MDTSGSLLFEFVDLHVAGPLERISECRSKLRDRHRSMSLPLDGDSHSFRNFAVSVGDVSKENRRAADRFREIDGNATTGMEIVFQVHNRNNNVCYVRMQ